MKPAVLVVDIGNTSTSAALYRAGRISNTYRLDTGRTSARTIRALVRRVRRATPVARAAIASVVPRVDARWRAALAAEGIPRAQTVRVTHRTRIGLPVSYPRPETIGADRLANACGAALRCRLPAIVADFGTALTFDVVLPRRGYVGGVIAPGLPLMFEYLAEKTAKLPHLKPGRIHGRIGTSTREAMQLGAKWGYRGMVREILKELRRVPALRRARVLATGGYAQWAVTGLPGITVDPVLTLRGLGRIADLNR